MRSLPGISLALCILCGPLAWAQALSPSALPPQPALATKDRSPRLPPAMLPIPLFRQATGYSCGACSLQAILCYWQVYSGQESQLYDRLGTTPKDGTAPEKLVEGARSFGLSARMQEGTTLKDLREALTQGTTVILNLQAWRDVPAAKPWKDTWEEGHYVVLAGMGRHHLYVMDPSVSGAYAYLPLQEFQDRWHDYENRTGTRHEYHHLAIFIRGAASMVRFPGPIVRME